MLIAIHSFLDTALKAEPPSVEALARDLDRLALAYAETPPGDPSEDERTPPRLDYVTTRDVVRERFSDLGFYGVVFDPLRVPPEEPVIGDAVDDIADIIGDLSEVLWRYETLGIDDANWDFRFGYEIHWGRHLHELRFYLYVKRFRSAQ